MVQASFCGECLVWPVGLVGGSTGRLEGLFGDLTPCSFCRSRVSCIDFVISSRVLIVLGDLV